MTDNEKYIHTMTNLYRGNSLLGFIKGLGVMVIGLLGIYSSLIGKIGNTDDSSWLYKNLGPEGMKFTGIVIFGVVFLVGCLWAYRRFRNLTVGIKEYREQLEAGVHME